MWIYIILLYLLTLIASKASSNQSSNNEQRFSNSSTLSVMPIQIISNNSFNSSLMENQLQEQNSLSNTSLSDLQNDNKTQQLQIRFRERKRNHRLISIQAQILQRLGITGRVVNTTNVNIFSDEERNLINRVVQGAPTASTRTRAVTGVNEFSSSEVLSERRQSFYPSCSVPNHTEPQLWNQNNESEMKLFYDISFARPSESRTEVTALSAKLRIHKCNDPPLEATPINNFVSEQMSQFVSEQGLTISVYQYMRPLRRNRRNEILIKKRLIDSRTVISSYRGYIEFNIIHAINHWKNNPIRNFGLYVDIEDPFGTRLDPSLYLSQMNCSVTVQDTPMPNLADILPDADNQTNIFDNENYPTLDLSYMEVTQDQQIIAPNIMNATEKTLRRKRLAQRANHHKDECKVEKMHISTKDLNLEGIVLYPNSFESVICSGHCHKHRVYHRECIPSDYKDVEFVFLTANGNPRIKKLDKFLPQSCKCVKRDEF